MEVQIFGVTTGQTAPKSLGKHPCLETAVMMFWDQPKPISSKFCVPELAKDDESTELMLLG